MTIKLYWSEEKGKYVDKSHSGQPRGNNATRARFVFMFNAAVKRLDKAETIEDEAWSKLKRARSCTMMNDKYKWSQKEQKFTLRRSERLRIPEYKAEYERVRRERENIETQLHKIKAAITGNNLLKIEKNYLTIIQSNDIKRVERAAKARAKREGHYYNNGRKVKDADIY